MLRENEFCNFKAKPEFVSDNAVEVRQLDPFCKNRKKGTWGNLPKANPSQLFPSKGGK